MTIEEKARAYDEALDKAKKELDACGSQDCDATRQIFRLFPELAESEDEKIRKELIQLISCMHDADNRKERWVAWLEKQGEQKPIDEAESEFKIGDWITFYGSKPFKILKVESEQNGILDYLLLDQNGHDTYYNKKYVDKNARLWTIQDAKDGDVLINRNNTTFIFKAIEDETVKFYIAYNEKWDAVKTPSTKLSHLGLPEPQFEFHPAIKEQRDTFEKAMADEGYTFDFEKKELKKIEDEEYNGKDYGIDSLFHAQRILEKTLGKVDGYQTDDGILSHKCAISTVKKLYAQKPMWSENDERHWKMCLDCVEDCAIRRRADFSKTIDWLKSIKQRMEEQQ